MSIHDSTKGHPNGIRARELVMSLNDGADPVEVGRALAAIVPERTTRAPRVDAADAWERAGEESLFQFHPADVLFSAWLADEITKELWWATAGAYEEAMGGVPGSDATT